MADTRARWGEHHTVRFSEHVSKLLGETAKLEQRSESSVIREAVAAFLFDRTALRNHQRAFGGTGRFATPQGVREKAAEA